MLSSVFPDSPKAMQAAGVTMLDFILVTGDAFIDHSSYGAAVIARVLKSHGYLVGVISQPDWRRDDDFLALGRPRLAFMVTAGAMDSMVSHYTVNRKRRSRDAYTPGGTPGKRPDRAVITYCAVIRRLFGHVPIVIGGIEASLRRFAHYDYWQDKVRRPILFDSQGDLLVYGMGEKAVIEIADGLDAGLTVADLSYIRGTGILGNPPEDAVILPDFDTVATDKRAFAEAAALIQQSNNPFDDRCYVQRCDDRRYFVQNPPQMPLTTAEMDAVYELPYTEEQLGGGPVAPSFGEVAFSVTANRGCFGSCSFCALAIHQGRLMQCRSKASILREITKMTQSPNFKGYIHDIGGPTANFRHPACQKQQTSGACAHRECLFPNPCPNLDADQREYADILREAAAVPGVKKVFVRSGIRYDYLMADADHHLLNRLVKHHISGQLRVAPEHVSDRVLKLMHKPPFAVYEAFCRRFEQANKHFGTEQYIVPYFISSHPGSTLADAIALAMYFRKHHMIPEQVQDFYPTPGTLATAMYYSGFNPEDMTPVTVPKGREKQLQRALLQFNRPENAPLVREALARAGRPELMKALCPSVAHRSSHGDGAGHRQKQPVGRKDQFGRATRGKGRAGHRPGKDGTGGKH